MLLHSTCRSDKAEGYRGGTRPSSSPVELDPEGFKKKLGESSIVVSYRALRKAGRSHPWTEVSASRTATGATVASAELTETTRLKRRNLGLRKVKNRSNLSPFFLQHLLESRCSLASSSLSRRRSLSHSAGPFRRRWRFQSGSVQILSSFTLQERRRVALGSSAPRFRKVSRPQQQGAHGS